MSRRTLSHFDRSSPGPRSRALPAVPMVNPAASNPHSSSLAAISDYTLRPSFIDCWTISGYQKSHISALERSPSGTWLLAASEDSTVLFLDFRSGWTIAKLTLDNSNGRFEILCAIWCSDTILLVGGSNGMIYILEFQPQNDSNPISLREILSPMPDPVKRLALDASQTYLAVAYGTQVAIYHRAAAAGFDSWTFHDRIPKPFDGEGALVHTMVFFGPAPCSLLVAYSAAGISIWRSPQRVRHFDAERVPNVCRVGDVSLSADERFIAMTTLDQAVVTYPMSHDGPCVEEMHVYEFPEKSRESPALPVALTPSNLVLSGTAVGDVAVVYPNAALAFSLHQGKNHVIRAIATYCELIAVASSGPSGILIKCYMTQTHGDGAISWGRGPAPTMMRVTLMDALTAGRVGHDQAPVKQLEARITEVVDMEEPQTTQNAANPANTPDQTQNAKDNNQKKLSNLVPYLWAKIIEASSVLTPWRPLLRFEPHVLVSYVAVGFALLTLVLSTTLPGVLAFKETQKPSNDTQIFKASYQPDEMWLIFGIRYFFKYIKYQVGSWLGWMVHGSLMCIIGLPRMILNKVVRGIAGWICAQVDLYRELGLCPDA